MIRLPSGSGRRLAADGLDDPRRAQDAAVGDRGVGGRHLHRRDRLALADRQVAHRGVRVVLAREHDAGLLAGQVDAGGLAEAEAPHPLVEAGRPHRQADLDRADVGGLLDDLRRGQRPVGLVVRLADRPVGDLDLRGQLERLVGRDLAVLQRAGHGERLERRARLVRRLHRAVLAGPGGRLLRGVGVDARPVGHGQQLAVVRVHDDRRRALRGAELLPDVGEDVLRLLLDAVVDGQLERVALAGPALVVELDRVAERVLDEQAAAVVAVQLGLVLLLEARRGRCCRSR